MIYIKRIFLIVLDSLGIGELPDAHRFGDTGSNTLKTLYDSGKLNIPCLEKLGLFNISGNGYANTSPDFSAVVAAMSEASAGKDTTVGHWEIAGVISNTPLPTYPNGFPKDVISKLEESFGRGILCNKTYSGTQVILDYGAEHEKKGDLIVYTSSDSVLQIAAHENIVPPERLHEYCRAARNIMTGEHAVGRIIARPFIGEYPNYTRTSNRHDFSLEPPNKTALSYLSDNNYDVVAVGKINDIFAGQGITEYTYTVSNADGMEKTLEYLNKDFTGLCFVNLVDFDSKYGHRNDVSGYTAALNEFDAWLCGFIEKINSDDLVVITGDHGCDPRTDSTDHSREYTPMIAYRKNIKPTNLGIRSTFADIGKTILDNFCIKNDIDGVSFLKYLI